MYHCVYCGEIREIITDCLIINETIFCSIRCFETWAKEKLVELDPEGRAGDTRPVEYYGKVLKELKNKFPETSQKDLELIAKQITEQK